MVKTLLDNRMCNPISSWIVTPKPNKEARLRLFCFHYAGGSASLYRLWPDSLPPTIEVCAIQLPGRENRLPEPPFTQLAPLLDKLAQAIRPHLTIPFAFFGHSLGAFIAFELTRYLKKQDGLSPVHLMVSGRGAPQIPDPDPPIHQLPEADFLTALRHLGGTPEEVLQNTDIMELMLPTIRADLSISETHTYLASEPLACHISAFGGQDDQTVTYAEVAGWQEQTSKRFQLRFLPGNHFFLHSSRTMLLQAVAQDLGSYI